MCEDGSSMAIMLDHRSTAGAGDLSKLCGGKNTEFQFHVDFIVD